jgi:hypothetical protein
MNTNTYDRDKITERLKPIIPLIYEALEMGAQEARDYFEERGKDIEPYLASDLVRYGAKQFLISNGIESAIEESFGMEDIPLNGLFAKYENLNIRIFKVQDCKLPTTGHSKTRKDFYQQKIPFTEDEWSDISPEHANLIILWRTDSFYHIGESFELICPKNGGYRKEMLEYHWKITLNPIDMLSGNSEHISESPQDLDFPEQNLNNKERENKHGNNQRRKN